MNDMWVRYEETPHPHRIYYMAVVLIYFIIVKISNKVQIYHHLSKPYHNQKGKMN